MSYVYDITLSNKADADLSHLPNGRTDEIKEIFKTLHPKIVKDSLKKADLL